MTSSGKVRIYELSRDLGLENKDVLDAAEKLSIAVKSHSSSISDGEAERIRSLISTPGNGGGAPAGQPVRPTPPASEPAKAILSVKKAAPAAPAPPATPTSPAGSAKPKPAVRPVSSPQKPAAAAPAPAPAAKPVIVKPAPRPEIVAQAPAAATKPAAPTQPPVVRKVVPQAARQAPTTAVGTRGQPMRTRRRRAGRRSAG